VTAAVLVVGIERVPDVPRWSFHHPAAISSSPPLYFYGDLAPI
jgi:hypothetical protein